MNLACWYDPPTDAPSDFRQTNNTATNTKPTHVYHATYTNASEGLKKRKRVQLQRAGEQVHMCAQPQGQDACCCLWHVACGHAQQGHVAACGGVSTWKYGEEWVWCQVTLLRSWLRCTHSDVRGVVWAGRHATAMHCADRKTYTCMN